MAYLYTIDVFVFMFLLYRLLWFISRHATLESVSQSNNSISGLFMQKMEILWNYESKENSEINKM